MYKCGMLLLQKTKIIIIISGGTRISSRFVIQIEQEFGIIVSFWEGGKPGVPKEDC